MTEIGLLSSMMAIPAFFLLFSGSVFPIADAVASIAAVRTSRVILLSFWRKG